MDSILNFLKAIEIQSEVTQVELIGNGLVNNTWLLHLKDQKKIIVQKVNTNVFKKPFDIDSNLKIIATHLQNHYPDYLFTRPLSNKDGTSLFQVNDDFYRAYHYVESSFVYNSLDNENLAYEAAKQFGKFTKLCSTVDINLLKTTIPNFHNLSIRYALFEKAVTNAAHEKKMQAQTLIDEIISKKYIVKHYENIISNSTLQLRVIHHDTKINNVLFNKENIGICIIDLDTIMPGFYISDVGDMMRTYLSPTDENNTNFSDIYIRENFFKAVVQGYLDEMHTILTEEELVEVVYSGQFMIYMQALRFLTDFLEDDIYYGAKTPLENYHRAKNQLVLLHQYEHNRYIHKYNLKNNLWKTQISMQ